MHVISLLVVGLTHPPAPRNGFDSRQLHQKGGRSAAIKNNSSISDRGTFARRTARFLHRSAAVSDPAHRQSPCPSGARHRGGPCFAGAKQGENLGDVGVDDFVDLVTRAPGDVKRISAGVIDIGSRPSSDAAARTMPSCSPYSFARMVPGNQPSPYRPAARIIRGAVVERGCQCVLAFRYPITIGAAHAAMIAADHSRVPIIGVTTGPPSANPRIASTA
jgi:hypothetical protein